MVPAPLPSLSLLIPTFGRDSVLFATVTSLLPQLQGDDEIVVIDQNQPALIWPPHLKHHARLRINEMKYASLTAARNLAIRISVHDSLVFLDDDIVPAENLLQQFRFAVQKKPQAVWTGTVQQEDRPDKIEGVGYFNRNTGEIVTDFNQPPAGEIPFFPGCLHLLPRSVLPQKEWYATAFRGAAQGEEIDMALRLKAAGVSILCDPNIRIRHLKSASGGCRTEAYQRRFASDQIYNQALLFGRHGNLSTYRLFLARQKNFIEFHTRLKKGGHSYWQVLVATQWMLRGFTTGLLSRR